MFSGALLCSIDDLKAQLGRKVQQHAWTPANITKPTVS